MGPNCYLSSIQVFTGVVPFSNEQPFTAGYSIMQGKRPPRPMHPAFTDDLWILMQRCWDDDPHLRPRVSEVLEVLLIPSVPYPFLRSYIR